MYAHLCRIPSRGVHGDKRKGERVYTICARYELHLLPWISPSLVTASRDLDTNPPREGIYRGSHEINYPQRLHGRLLLFFFNVHRFRIAPSRRENRSRPLRAEP